jgi:hypothetical protein
MEVVPEPDDQGLPLSLLRRGKSSGLALCLRAGALLFVPSLFTFLKATHLSVHQSS